MSTTVLRASTDPFPSWGTWTHTPGDTEETVSIAGIVFMAIFVENDTNDAYSAQIPWSVSISGNTTTITIHSQAKVTSGKFAIWHSR